MQYCFNITKLLNFTMYGNFNFFLFGTYLSNKESFFEYYEVIILVKAWSNTIKPNDRFDQAPTEIITS